MADALVYVNEVVIPQLKIEVEVASENAQSWFWERKEELWNYFNSEYAGSIYNVIFSVYGQVFLALIGIWAAYQFIYKPFLKDYVIAERCRVHLENEEPVKIGDTIIFSISGFLELPSLLTDSKMDLHTQTFFNGLTARITLEEERIPAMKAYAEEEYGRIKLMFTGDKSGTYSIEMQFNGFVLPGSPLQVTVPPDFLCPGETEAYLPSTPVIITDGMPQTIEIVPKDRTGYPCSWEGVRLDKFDFHASTENSMGNVSIKGKVCEIIGGYWKEGLDASYSYGGNQVGTSPAGDQLENPITILLVLRTNRSPNSHGIFEGQISYDGQIIKNGCFPIISLSALEYERLEPTLKEPKPTDVIQLKAQLLQPNTMVPATDRDIHGLAQREMLLETDLLDLKDVFVNVCLKFICIKEVVWTVLLNRTALFPIQGDTRIEAMPETDEKKRYLVTIWDASQPDGDEQNNVSCISRIRLLMPASNTRMLMALFLKFRGSVAGGKLTFQEKCDHFFEKLKMHADVQASFHQEAYQKLHLSRPDLVRTSFEETKHFETGHWCNPFLVSFFGEPVLEHPTAWLDWSDLVLEYVLENDPNGMFHTISEKSGYVHPNSSRNFRRWPIQYYEMTGKLVGKYLVERAMNPQSLNFRIKARFSRSFLLQLIGSPPTCSSMERDLPELFESTLKSLQQNSGNEDDTLTFCIPLYDTYGRLDQMIPIIENGEQVIVTADNTEHYLSALARYHLFTKVSKEIVAFRSGLISIVPEDYLLNFDENELELLLCGWSKFDLNQIKKHNKIIGEEWHPEFPRILKWFWTSLSTMSPVDQARFLQFVTGSSILPLRGFESLNPPLTISMTCLYAQRPVADSGAHAICLSDHPTYEEFDKAIITAVRTAACCQDKPNKMECAHPSKHPPLGGTELRDWGSYED